MSDFEKDGQLAVSDDARSEVRSSPNRLFLDHATERKYGM